MKTPKVTKPPTKGKIGGPKAGKVQKNPGNIQNKKSTVLTNVKTAGQALNLLKSNKENVNITFNKKKGKKFSLGEDVDKSSKGNVQLTNSEKTVFKGNQSKPNKTKLVSPVNGSKQSPPNIFAGKKTGKSKILNSDVENNSSPIKFNSDLKKVKLPFPLNSPALTPVKSKKEKNKQIRSTPSPEVLLGLQLEQALSPKSKKEKKKLLLKQKLQDKGKTEVSIKSNGIPAENEKNMKKMKVQANVQNDNTQCADSLFQEVNARNALKALLNSSKASKADKKQLLSEDQFIYVQCNLLKISDLSKSVRHITLPHSILPENPDICLVTADIKGKRNDPDEAIDFYKDLLKKKGIDNITEVIPLRKLKTEYSSFEQKRNMVNRFDAILVDSKISKMARIGRRLAGAKKCVGIVQLRIPKWQPVFDKALRKVAVFSGGNGVSLSVKCGRVGMPVNDIVENIMSIGNFFSVDKVIIGDQTNVSSVYVKTALSPSFPIYVSIASPNVASLPEGKKRKLEEPVEDEVSTVLGASVVVFPSGNIKVKKQKGKDVDFYDEKPKTIKVTFQDSKKKQKLHNLPVSQSDSESEDDLDVEDSDVENNDDMDGESEIDDESEEEVDEGETDEDKEETNEGNDSSDSDSVEEATAAAEREYLEEFRLMQERHSKNKKKGIKSMPEVKPSEPTHENIKNGEISQNNQTSVPQKTGNKLTNKKKLKNKKSNENKPESKQGNQKKPEKEQGNQKKLENKQANQKKPDNKPANQKKPENKQNNLKKPENKQANQNKIENKLAKQNKPEKRQFEQKNTENKQFGQKKPKNKQFEQKSPDNKQFNQSNQNNILTKQNKTATKTFQKIKEKGVQPKFEKQQQTNHQRLGSNQTDQQKAKTAGVDKPNFKPKKGGKKLKMK